MSSRGTAQRGRNDDGLVMRGVAVLVQRDGAVETARKVARRVKSLEATVQSLESRVKALENLLNGKVPQSR